MTNPPETGQSRPSRRRLALVASAVALLFLAGLFAVLRPSGDEESASPTAAAPTDELTATTETGSGSTEAETATEPAPATTAAPPTETVESGPTRIRINVSGGRPAGGIKRVSVPAGDDVLLVVRADAPEVVHLHGYDREAPVAPNAPAQLGFKADQPGRFEVELENSAVLIAEISVEP